MLTAPAQLPELVSEIGSPGKINSKFWLTVAAITIAGILVRIPGLFTDFWGDEIWSWSIAGKLHSITDILLADPARIDNNHPINTLWLYMLGPHRPVWLYRLPALVFGSATIPLAARIMFRRGRCEAIIAATLIAFSYPLVLYSSEARGYAAVVFFAFLAFNVLEQACLAPTKLSARWLFGVVCTLGFLSHLTFLHVYLAAIITSYVLIGRHAKTGRVRFKGMLLLHALPLGSVLLIYRLFIIHMVIGGAAATSTRDVVLQAISLTAGGGFDGPGTILPAAALVSLFIAGFVILLYRSDGLALWSIVAAVISPLVICGQELLVSPHPQPLMVRYFLVCLAISLLPVASALGAGWRVNVGGKVCVSGLLILFVMGNSFQIGRFIAFGRGHYQAALIRIAGQSDGKTIAIASDNPVRTGMMLEFYGPRVFGSRIVEVSDSPALWLILNRSSNVADTHVNYRNHRYLLVDVYPYAGLSGWAWHVYRQQPGDG